MPRRNFRNQNSDTDMLSAGDFYAPIHTFLDSRLAELGFVRPKRGVWVRENCMSGRPMFELWHLKGKISLPVWGFALNYAPHLNNSHTKLLWHRTVKSAKLNAFPFDEFDQTQGLTRLAAPQDHAIAVNHVLGVALDRAMEFFGRFQSTSDLLPLFERLQRYKGRSLGYWNYMNVPVAHAFTLRINGEYARGKSILDEYAERMDISGPALTQLLSRFEQAAADPSLL